MEFPSLKKVTAWLAVSISAVFANVWAFWGIKENFHEGWYFESFWSNIATMFGQYLLMPISFMVLAVVSIRWNKVGGLLHVVVAVASFLFFGTRGAGFLMVALPLAGLGLLYWFGALSRRKLAIALVAGLPVLQIIAFGAIDGIRVANRFNDGNFQARTIEGNGVVLTWAPEGPGWPDDGTPWEDAKRICAHLDSTGTLVTESELNIWRLPTIAEAVKSQVYHGTNAGGVWDSTSRVATYTEQPDKESPLWNMHKRTVYWWTSSETSGKDAFIIVYNGGVYPRAKRLHAAYLNFRAVKNAQ
jgi:hypothetical protein